MNRLIALSIYRPIAVVAAVLMVVMFGLAALQVIPIQLAPDVDRPVLSVSTPWPGAAPAEIEREIINRQENVLSGLEGLESITSRSESGRARVTLEFAVGQDMDKALLLVSNRLDTVGSYPVEVDEPTLSTAGSEDNPIAWLVLHRAEGNERPIHTYYNLAEDHIKDRLERVPGVSNVNIYGGSEREMQLIVDPERLALMKMTLSRMIASLRAANASISAGSVDEGKRRYAVRTQGDFTSLESVRNVVLRSVRDPVTGGISRVTVADVADVNFSYKKPGSRLRMMGQPALALPVYRETGANVIEVMAGVRAVVANANQQILQRENLHLAQVYDETDYIDSAINLVRQNIFVGGALAALVLMLFLRSGGATLVVSLAIPVSVVGAFVAMAALGRSINVISLAGLAFAVGMVVDAAIVVMDNIFRHRQLGADASQAARNGAEEVWGAVLVSALTTVMVFIPILIMDLEVGQLFRDIAVAISVSVLLSLIVAITVIPALSGRLLRGDIQAIVARRRIAPLDRFASLFAAFIMVITRAVTQSRWRAGMMVVAITLISGTVSWLLLPKLDYLPEGDRNLVFGFVLPPPGYNLDTMTEIAAKLEDKTRPLWDVERSRSQIEDGTPTIERFFFAAFRANAIAGVVAVDPSRARDLIPVLRGALASEPATYGFFRQSSLFGRGIGGTRGINLDISGGSLEEITAVAQRAFAKVSATLPPQEGTQIRPRPSLSLGAPEVRVAPNPTGLADNGITTLELGQTLDAFNDGVRIAEITVDGTRIDLTLKGPPSLVPETQGISNIPVVTSDGVVIPASSLADINVTSGPTEIFHREGLRTVVLQISPPQHMSLEEAMTRIREEVIAPLQAEGVPESVTFGLSGAADKLTATWNEMVFDLLMALGIVYLVMAVLFESFFYPLIIILSVPLATAGGVIGLVILSIFQNQNLDMLTLLGFVILVGIVVNNAILLVHQTLHHLRRDHMTPQDSILEATRNRIRPIFMSTLTSVLGMMPLVLFPGAGSELYRGLGSVVIGGLALSAVLTLLIIPPLLSLFLALIEKRPDENAAPLPSLA